MLNKENNKTKMIWSISGRDLKKIDLESLYSQKHDAIRIIYSAGFIKENLSVISQLNEKQNFIVNNRKPIILDLSEQIQAEFDSNNKKQKFLWRSSRFV